MFKRIDESRFLIKMLERTSSFLAKQRGFPIVLGVICIAAGGILQLTNVFLGSILVEVSHIIFQHFGIITALVGILLLGPIGE